MPFNFNFKIKNCKIWFDELRTKKTYYICDVII